MWKDPCTWVITAALLVVILRSNDRLVAKYIGTATLPQLYRHLNEQEDTEECPTHTVEEKIQNRLWNNKF